MKYVLVLWLCSVISGKCTSSVVPGYQYKTHWDCVYSGYGFSQKVFTELEDREEWDKDYINKHKMVVKFECLEFPEDKIIIPKKKPKIIT